MKTVKLILIVMLGSSIILWVRSGEDFHIAKVFPLLGGYEPGTYDIAAAALCLIAFIGWRRLNRRKRDAR
jgi:hypothetical protein